MDKKTLRDAMLNFERLDGSDAVFNNSGAEPERRRFMPPIIQAGYQRSDGNVEDEVRKFERLSLAARSRLLDLNPPVDAAGAFPVIHPDVIMEAVTETAALLGAECGTSDHEVVNHARMQRGYRGGLQLVGFRIASEPSGAVGRQAPLRLTNTKLPFSIRLIGCVIESPIFANNCELVSLDLSGSALHGFDAHFLRARGSVRLRRMAAFGPVDLASAHIQGHFDATDVVIQALARPEKHRGFAADRGALNLSQAVIESEVYLNRARIWGGLTLKGATVTRSMFMDDAIIRSPVAVVELECCNLAGSRLPNWTTTDGESLEDVKNQELDLVRKKIWSDQVTAQPERSRLCHELLQQRGELELKNTTMEHLLADSMRARTSAIRADGLKVDGSIFARELRCSGRVRFKYARIMGGLHLEGAWLRSMDATARTFKRLDAIADQPQLAKLRETLKFGRETFEKASRAERPGRDDFALDITEAVIAGNVMLGAREPGWARSKIDGVVSAPRCEVKGKVDFTGAVFCMREKNPAPADPLFSETSKEELLPSLPAQVVFDGAIVGDDILLVRTMKLRGFSIEGAHLQGSLCFGQTIEPTQLRADSVPEHAKPLRPRIWVWDRVGALFRAVANEDNGQTQLLARGRALEIGGAINLRGAEIDGDAILLFDRMVGPDIRANGAKIHGALSIYPTVPSNEISWKTEQRPTGSLRSEDLITFSLSDYNQRSRAAGDERRRLTSKAFAYNSSEWERRRQEKRIDLTDAGATTFCHPPMAWPLPEGLLITGFTYGRTSNLGPLAPYPFFDGREQAKALTFWASGLLLFVGLALLAIPFVPPGSPHSPRAVTVMRDFLTAAGVGNSWILAGLLIFSAGRLLSQNLIPPRLKRSTPMAERYLALQVFRRNRYRTRGRIFAPLGPYAQAARSLRKEGRPISADIIEIERLRLRTRMLSSRHHLLTKVALRISDLVSAYGFNITRTVVVAAFMIVIGAMVAQHAYNSDVLIANTPPNAASTSAEGKIPGSAEPTASPRFNPLVHSANTAVPILELKEQTNWEFTNVARLQKRAEVYKFLLWCLQLAGWGLTTAIAASLAVHAENVLTRAKD